MLPNDENITAWFRDAATRHTSIRHSDADEKSKRFFEEEWDDMVRNQRQLANENWYLILEDYVERYNDNGGEYYSQMPTISFMVLKHVPTGNAARRMTVWQEARAIAKDIVDKLHTDSLSARETCEADVPEDVRPPAWLNINSISMVRVSPSNIFLNSHGVRVTLSIRTDHEVSFVRDDSKWLPLD